MRYVVSTIKTTIRVELTFNCIKSSGNHCPFFVNPQVRDSDQLREALYLTIATHLGSLDFPHHEDVFIFCTIVRGCD